MADVFFPHLLTSNNPPDDSEIAHIRSTILNAQDHLSSLDAKLHQLESVAQSSDTLIADQQRDARLRLLMLRDEQRALLRRFRSTLSSLRHFPPEIMVLIFSFALPSGEKGVPMDSNSFLWRASQVCRFWRGIICGCMQYVWSSIEIDYLRTNRHNLTSTLLELALQRSGARPLSIRFCFSHRNRLDVLTRNEELCLNLLTKESFRWAELELDYIPIAALDSLSAAVKTRIPLLRRLIIENVPMNLELNPPSTVDAFEVVPRLEHFGLSGYFRPSRFQLPWSQLTSYTGSFRDIKDFLIVLNLANNLSTCDVFLHNYNAGFVVDHPNIRMLRIGGALEGLSRVRLPALKTLVSDELIVQDLGLISLFIYRTPSIDSLEVHIPHESGASNSMDILLGFMNACRNISSLVLMGEIDLRIVCSLLNTHGGRVLMPRLRHLSLSVLSTTNTESADILTAMLESRRRSSHDGPDDVYLSSLTLLALRVPSALFQRLKPLEDTLEPKVVVKVANA